jgi:glycosyltransferase 2 family protein
LSPRIRTVLVNIGGFGLAALLLYLALRGVDLREISEALRTADYRWLIPVVAVLLGSHYLRAIRWCALMEVIGDDDPADGRPRRGLAFASIMIGYMVNYAAPRLGEVARTANFARQSGLPFSGVLGTVVAERVLDVAALGVGVLIVAVMLSDRLHGLLGMLFEGQDVAGAGLLVAAGLLTLVLAIGLLFLFGRLVRASGIDFYSRWAKRVRPVVHSFRDGVMATIRAPKRGVIIVTTVAMWLCYMVAAYIPFAMLDLTQPYGIGLAAAWVMMILGSIGVVVPSPGGVGSYHFITIQGLVYLYGMGAGAAASYAFLTHAAQLVLYVTAGALCMAGQMVLSRRKAAETSG